MHAQHRVHVWPHSYFSLAVVCCLPALGYACGHLQKTRHAGRAPTKGEKWVATKVGMLTPSSKQSRTAFDASHSPFCFRPRLSRRRPACRVAALTSLCCSMPPVEDNDCLSPFAASLCRAMPVDPRTSVPERGRQPERLL